MFAADAPDDEIFRTVQIRANTIVMVTKLLSDKLLSDLVRLILYRLNTPQGVDIKFITEQFQRHLKLPERRRLVSPEIVICQFCTFQGI